MLNVLLLVGACASGGQRDPATGEAALDAATGSTDAGVDVSETAPALDASPDAHADGGSACPPGRHRCGESCADDGPDDPSTGCRLGCGMPCPVPEHAEAICTSEGRCDFRCVPPATRSGDGCRCTPRTCADVGAACGTIDDGCGGRRECGSCASGSCVEGRCRCGADDVEPNDAQLAATALRELTDAPDSLASYETWNLHEATDVDWLRMRVRDEFDAGNPIVTVTLDASATGHDLDLGAWYVCDAGGDGSACTMGAGDAMLGRGCLGETVGDVPESVRIEAECSGTNDTGTLFVRVRARTWSGRCDPYRLRVEVR
ncbi:MAG: hypothetical protein NZ898_03840 [Myxococcota bacterium]|nr:hypothetical protein [Myxococcota bacterium]MDW8362947.1 hypothetical protein [Myxococcales bacterium]